MATTTNHTDDMTRRLAAGSADYVRAQQRQTRAPLPRPVKLAPLPPARPATSEPPILRSVNRRRRYYACGPIATWLLAAFAFGCVLALLIYGG